MSRMLVVPPVAAVTAVTGVISRGILRAVAFMSMFRHVIHWNLSGLDEAFTGMTAMVTGAAVLLIRRRGLVAVV